MAATLGTRLFTWLHGEFVGEDSYGNRYYRDRKAPKRGRRKRWVIYADAVDASRVAPQWSAWLHHVTAEPPTGEQPEIPWEKEPVPNLTGTALAYRPPGHPLRGGKRDHATGDYEAWTPPS
jgi:NADH:ubiquinone oxidoreductase subunit